MLAASQGTSFPFIQMRSDFCADMVTPLVVERKLPLRLSGHCKQAPHECQRAGAGKSLNTGRLGVAGGSAHLGRTGRRCFAQALGMRLTPCAGPTTVTCEESPVR